MGRRKKYIKRTTSKLNKIKDFNKCFEDWSCEVVEALNEIIY